MRKKKALKATFWSGSDLLLRQGVQFITLVALARFLTPADFGLVAMLALVSGIAGIILDGGLSSALIQKRNPSKEDEASVFFFNISAGLVMAVSVYFAAPWIASFYGNDSLIRLVHITALGCVVAGFLPIHTALLTRSMDFVTLAKAGGIASMLSGSLSVLLAWWGYRAEVLVLYPVLTSGLTSIILWRLHPWRPRAGFSWAALRELAQFGIYHMGAGLLEMVFSRLYTPLAGRLMGAQSLGLYVQADNIRQLPGNFLGGMVARVALPLFASNIDDRVSVVRGFQLSIRVMMLINAPIMLAMAMFSDDVLIALMGDSWVSAAPLLRILAIAGLLFPLHVLNIQLLLSLGYSALVFKLQVYKNIVSVVCLIVGLKFGLEGLAWSQVALSVASIFINGWYTGKFLNFGVIKQLGEAWAPLTVAAFACFLVGWIEFFVYVEVVYVRLAIKLLMGGALFLLLSFTFRLNALTELLDLVRPSLARN